MLGFLHAQMEANEHDFHLLLGCGPKPQPDYHDIAWNGWAFDRSQQDLDVGGLTLKVFHPIGIIWCLSRPQGEEDATAVHGAMLINWYLFTDPWAT